MRVRHRAGLFEHADDARDRRLLLADRDVDGVERPVVRVAGRLGRLVETRLADDRVDADRRLAGRAVADDQLALAAADRDHRVDRHDAGLHRLADRAAPDDAGGQLLDRIGDVAGDRPLAVERLAERVDDAAEQALADRHLQQPAGGADFVAFLQLRVVAEDDRADLGLVEVQRQAGDAAAEVEHLVQHHVAEPLDVGDAVADLADRADGLLGGRGLRARDLRFDFLDQVSHVFVLSAPQARFQRGQPGAHAAVVDVAADLDAHAADERRVLAERRLERPAVGAREAGRDLLAQAPRRAAWRSRRAPCAGRDRAAPAAGRPASSAIAPRRREPASARCRPGARALVERAVDEAQPEQLSRRPLRSPVCASSVSVFRLHTAASRCAVSSASRR